MRLSTGVIAGSCATGACLDNFTRVRHRMITAQRNYSWETRFSPTGPKPVEWGNVSEGLRYSTEPQQ
jgi:hypothetical protein